MTFKIPQEILTHHIYRFLEEKDVNHLASCSKHLNQTVLERRKLALNTAKQILNIKNIKKQFNRSTDLNSTYSINKILKEGAKHYISIKNFKEATALRGWIQSSNDRDDVTLVTAYAYQKEGDIVEAETTAWEINCKEVRNSVLAVLADLRRYS